MPINVIAKDPSNTSIQPVGNVNNSAVFFGLSGTSHPPKSGWIILDQGAVGNIYEIHLAVTFNKPHTEFEVKVEGAVNIKDLSRHTILKKSCYPVVIPKKGTYEPTHNIVVTGPYTFRYIRVFIKPTSVAFQGCTLSFKVYSNPLSAYDPASAQRSILQAAESDLQAAYTEVEAKKRELNSLLENVRVDELPSASTDFKAQVTAAVACCRAAQRQYHIQLFNRDAVKLEAAMAEFVNPHSQKGELPASTRSRKGSSAGRMRRNTLSRILTLGRGEDGDDDDLPSLDEKKKEKRGKKSKDEKADEFVKIQHQASESSKLDRWSFAMKGIVDVLLAMPKGASRKKAAIKDEDLSKSVEIALRSCMGGSDESSSSESQIIDELFLHLCVFGDQELSKHGMLLIIRELTDSLGFEPDEITEWLIDKFFEFLQAQKDNSPINLYNKEVRLLCHFDILYWL